MLEITKTPITQDQFVEKVQALCPDKFSDTGLKIMFDYLKTQVSDVYLPDLCTSDFQESLPGQCSKEVRHLLLANPDTDKVLILEVLKKDLGTQFIGMTETTVVWWNG